MIARMEAVRAAVNAALEAALADLPDGDLTDAMRYACVGGKRVRAFLVLESARLHGVADAHAMPVAVAVEMLHAYSLVHDDLPAMDDDDLRRGMPTVHIQWSEATAILAGDALQARAFEMLADPAIGDCEIRVALLRRFAAAVGAGGMVWGQARDIAAETAVEPLDLAEVKALQQAKTGALIQFAATAGAVMAGADPAPLSEYAKGLGLAFQIADDILDVTGDPEQTGKRTGKDARLGKATFVSLLGLDEARDKAAAIVARAEAALNDEAEGVNPDAAGNLRQLARFVIHRQT
ncbi:polyprenyl synthetase family protein [Paracoccus sanguinis]|uniref:Geranylgeranyl diphosphate synthase n=1 Tax=Paracoccus sanguinis TaxID=1545044 RepID=A0A1H3C3F7_9RHOB|nr:farnesyl diphosphate synthase [Paracoccus sanguinis]KGJ17173.1 farnesyl-diphosphate synthase [Paracoccus sanguinis]SDX48049.1 farnesyl-diphosphate synthase [Paracoccus sanguinis]